MSTTEQVLQLQRRADELGEMGPQASSSFQLRLCRALDAALRVLALTGEIPALYCDDLGTVEARWFVGSSVIDVEWGPGEPGVALYVFNREIKQITRDLTIHGHSEWVVRAVHRAIDDARLGLDPAGQPS